MKATEFRLGNYVYGINRRSEIHIPTELPLKILQIELFNTYVLPLDQNPATVEKWFKITNEDLSPIPLTEEWKIKSGLKYDKLGHYYYHNAFDSGTYFVEEAEWPVYGDFDECVYIRLPKYVHQWQNLYFVLKEKELTL